MRLGGPPAEASVEITFGDMQIDLAVRRIRNAGREIHLTPIEYRLLIAPLSHPGKVLTQRHLLKEVWGPAYIDLAHYLRIYLGHPRQKLEDDPARPQFLFAETGIGYRFAGA